MGMGYRMLCSKIQEWLHSSHNSLCHNQKTLQKLFALWGRSQIHMGNNHIWDAVAASVRFSSGLPLINLWMDSTDFPLTGKSTTLRKSAMWSYKENGPTQRYMLICDGNMYVRQWWGGYSPKLYDGDFLKSHSDEVNLLFCGAGVIADCHFELGPKYCNQVTWIMLHSKKRGRQKAGTSNNDSSLTQAQLKFNSKLHKL